MIYKNVNKLNFVNNYLNFDLKNQTNEHISELVSHIFDSWIHYRY